MKLKEKKIPVSEEPERISKAAVNPVAALFLSAFFGFLAAGTRLGGNGAPLCTAITAAVPTFSGFAAFIGAMASFFVSGTFSAHVTEMIAMPAVIFARATLSPAFGRKIGYAASAGLAAAGYIICGLAASMAYKITAALILAIIFRGAVCGAAAYFFSKLLRAAEDGSVFASETKTALAAVYVLAVCMLGGIGFGAFNAGRIAGAFAILAASFRYGFAGGAAVGALSAFAFGTITPSMTSTAAIAVCAGTAAGYVSGKSKLYSAAAFLGTVFAGSLIYGMPSDSAKLIADATVAAAAFYVVPEKLYSKPFGRTSAPVSAAAVQSSDKLKFAAAAVADVRESFSKAAEVLERGDFENDISASVCGKVCAACRNGAFCGDSPEHRTEAFFRPAEAVLRKKGFITERELPDTLDHCPRRSALAEAFNEMYRLTRMEKRSGDLNGSMRELTLEQLSETEDMLRYLSSGSETFLSCDENLSERFCAVLKEYGAKKPSAAAL